MKIRKDWPRWTPLAVCGLIACALWFVLAVDGLPATVWWPQRSYLPETADTVIRQLFSDYSQTPAQVDTFLSVDSILDSVQINDGQYHKLAYRIQYENDSRIYGMNDQFLPLNTDTVYWTAGGPGSDTIKVWAYDTTGAGDSTAVSNVKVTAKDGTDEQAAVLMTQSSGYCKFTLDAGYYTFLAFRAGWFFDPKGITLLGSDTTISIQGYEVPLQEPDDPATIVVQGNVTRIGGLADVVGVRICAYHTPVTGKGAVDTVGGAKIILPLAGCDVADTSGYFSIPLIKSSEYIDTTMGFYTFVATFGGQPMWKIESLYLTGNINLGDSIAAR